MAFKPLPTLDSDVTIALGGVNRKDNKPNPTSVTGFYLGAKEVPSAMSSTGKCFVHIFQTETGNVGVWGKTNLDRALATAPKGMLLRATYTGLQKNPPKGRSPAYLYSVEADDSQTIDVNGMAAPAATDEYSSDYSDDVADDVDAEPAYAAPRAPATPARAPTADQTARVQALLGKRK